MRTIIEMVALIWAIHQAHQLWAFGSGFVRGFVEGLREGINGAFYARLRHLERGGAR